MFFFCCWNNRVLIKDFDLMSLVEILSQSYCILEFDNTLFTWTQIWLTYAPKIFSHKRSNCRIRKWFYLNINYMHKESIVKKLLNLQKVCKTLKHSVKYYSSIRKAYYFEMLPKLNLLILEGLITYPPAIRLE